MLAMLAVLCFGFLRVGRLISTVVTFHKSINVNVHQTLLFYTASS